MLETVLEKSGKQICLMAEFLAYRCGLAIHSFIYVYRQSRQLLGRELIPSGKIAERVVFLKFKNLGTRKNIGV